MSFRWAGTSFSNDCMTTDVRATGLSFSPVSLGLIDWDDGGAFEACRDFTQLQLSVEDQASWSAQDFRQAGAT